MILLLAHDYASFGIYMGTSLVASWFIVRRWNRLEGELAEADARYEKAMRESAPIAEQAEGEVRP